MVAIIMFIFWIFYCIMAGIYDGPIYRYVSPKTVYGMFWGIKIHRLHLMAFIQRAAVAFGLFMSCFLPWSFKDVLEVLAAGLCLPFLHTGAYLESRAWVSKKLSEPLPKDAKNKAYNFFSYTHKSSSYYPDHNPWFRLILFALGLALYALVNIKGLIYG